MKKTPPELDRIADTALAYRPEPTAADREYSRNMLGGIGGLG